MKTLKPTLLASAVSLALIAPSISGAEEARNAQDVQALQQEIQLLKIRYAEEVRKLRELDARLQALSGRAVEAQQPAAAVATPAAAAPRPPADVESQTAAVGDAEAQRKATPPRSVEDLLSEEHAVFDRRLTLEAGVEYARYDRKQLTLNGFLALDAIFLGNIAVENVESDTFTYNLAARYGLTPRTVLSLNAPFIQRSTTYQKGGAGGSAAVVAEEEVSDSPYIGDLTAGISYRLFPETPTRPDIVVSASVTAPTGRHPYGVNWRTIQSSVNPSDPNDIPVQFAVPEKQPTGNGIWAASVGASFVKTLDPAILFASIGYTHTFERSFNDLDINPDTVNPGDVDLGNSFNYGLGIAFALNERSSLSMSLAHKITGKSKIRYDGQDWKDVIGSDGNAATFNLGVTYALSPHLTLVTGLGIGLTPDAPDFSIGVKLPYIF